MIHKPNVVVVMTDQQRADLCAREGFPLDTTPFLDRLAHQGAWFTRAYTSMPVCGPARVSMLTGRYPSASRTRTNWNIADATYREDLFSLFRNHGYATALCGKNHSHLTEDQVDFWYEAGHLGIEDRNRTVQEKAFDAFLKTTQHHLSLEPTPFPVECQIPHRLVNQACDWVKSVPNKPWLLWLSFPEPHNPYQVPEPYYSLFPPDNLPPALAPAEALAAKGFKYAWNRRSFERAFPGYEESIPRARSNYLGLLRLLDDEIARFVAFLEKRGEMENTIVIFLSDHGDHVGDFGLLRKGSGLDESLARIPLIIRGPEIHALDDPRTEHVSICDLLPTLCEAAKIAVPDGVQGRSLWPLLTGADVPATEFASAYVEHGFGGLNYSYGEDVDPKDDGLTESRNGLPGAYDCLNSWTQSGVMRMVRKGRWKLVYDAQKNGSLYDLESDPAETNNLFDRKDLSSVRADLMEELATWLLRFQDPLPLPRQRYKIKRDPRNYWSTYDGPGQQVGPAHRDDDAQGDR